MKFAIARSPTSPLSPSTFYIKWVFTILLIVLACAQLILYEKFVPFIYNLHLFVNVASSEVFAAFIVVCEVMALPFLLRMSLSKLLRFVSGGCLFLLGVGWFILGLLGAGDNKGIVVFGVFMLATASFLLFRMRSDFK